MKNLREKEQIRVTPEGYIYLTDIEYRLTAEERKEHIKSIFEGLEKNPNLTIGVLLPTVSDNMYTGKDLSFYSNYKTGFLKKEQAEYPQRRRFVLRHQQQPPPLHPAQCLPEHEEPAVIPPV